MHDIDAMREMDEFLQVRRDQQNGSPFPTECRELLVEVHSRADVDACGRFAEYVNLARPAVSGASALATQVALIERVSRELAIYIGPIAEFVVKRAANRCESAQELCKTVAQEIESPADRMAFLRRCQQ